MIAKRPSTTQLSLIGFLVVLLLAWFCYRPALTGAFELDDVSNLSGLAFVEDAGTAVDFILSGAAGPVGRPLALATFALQAGQWEEGARAFLSVNILIHLFNAVLLAVCLYLLASQSGVARDRAVVVATATASLWVLLPLLATASLLVVQRMATLSALFTLLGLGAYLLARRRIDTQPGHALVGMGTALVAGTVLGTLSKESGLLLPVFVLVLESTVLTRPENVARWRQWQAVFLWLPTVAILAYLATRIAYPDWLVARRGFDAWERLLTETRMLWLYLQKALLGIPSRLGIYQPVPNVSRSLFEPLTLLASLSWLALIAVSILWRRRYPLLALAVLWYLGGHLIESTFVALELYFEHRNYVAVVGPLYAISCALLLGTDRVRRIGSLVIPAFILANAYFLYSFASLKGEASLAARYWAMHYPQSVRAVTTMATFQMAEEGVPQALATLDRFASENPQHAYLRIQQLNLRCLTVPEADHAPVLEQLRSGLPGVDFTYTAGRMLSQLFTTVVSQQCNGINAGTVVELADTLRRNPRYVDDPNYNQFHYKLLAGISRQQGDLTAALANLSLAMALKPSSELNTMMVTLFVAKGDYAAAYAFIDEVIHGPPLNPLRAIAWRRDLEKLRDYVGELERYSERGPEPPPGTGNEES